MKTMKAAARFGPIICHNLVTILPTPRSTNFFCYFCTEESLQVAKMWDNISMECFLLLFSRSQFLFDWVRCKLMLIKVFWLDAERRRRVWLRKQIKAVLFSASLEAKIVPKLAVHFSILEGHQRGKIVSMAVLRFSGCGFECRAGKIIFFPRTCCYNMFVFDNRT